METWLITFLLSVLVVAVVNDLMLNKIPNLLTYPTMAFAIIYHGVTKGPVGLIFSAGGLILGIALLILPYLVGEMGAGDAKLMGAVGAVLGPEGVFIAFLLTALAGGIYAFIVLMYHYRYSYHLFKRVSAMLKHFILTKQMIYISSDKKVKKPMLCYGIAIFFGTFFYIIYELSGYNWFSLTI
jgi:prepilin peptidase CpaA